MTAVINVPAKTDPLIPGGVHSTIAIDAMRLRRALRKAVSGEVRFDPATKAMYANDASNFRQVPIGVVIPKNLDDVVATHRICAQFGAPIVNRGGGTSLSGETVNVAVVIDNSKYLTKIGEPDVKNARVTVETGAINEQVNVRTGEQGLVFGPDPSSHSRCTIGGNVGNNSCGVHSVQSQLYGPGPRTSDNTHALEIVTYRGDRFWVGVNEEARLDEIIAAGGPKGEIYRQLRELRDRYIDDIRAGFPSVDELPRRVSGYNLDELLPEKGFNVARALVGTESTCVTVLQATLLLTPALFDRTLVTVYYPTAAQAGSHVVEIIDRWKPIGLEAIDHRLIYDQQAKQVHIKDIKELPRNDEEEGAWLMVQFGADRPEDSQRTAREFVEWLEKAKGYEPDRMVVMTSRQDGGNSEDLWELREAGLSATAFPPDGLDHWPGWEDSAVPPARIGEYLADLEELYRKHGLTGALYGHLGQGCVHSRISFDLRTPKGLKTYRAFMEEAADLVVSYGGSISGEHGDGQQRAELLSKQYGERLIDAMREFKRIWDPDWKMNPGKVIDPYRFDENLKLGVDYNPPRPKTRFAYPEDKEDFAHTALRCVGVGKCRVPQAEQTMCPSYHVTREEKHSTRGRARLLFEMLLGEVITDGWQSTEVADALDLCLACKGCTNDCPVNVDMPTYKAEFLHHHYRSWRRWRPRYAYAFGFIDQVARVATRFPELVNFATQTPGLSLLAKLAAGVDQRRPLPEFAPMNLQEWFKRRGTHNPNGRPVVLFPDTFNNYLHTDVGVACVEAIEAAGWRVIMPEQHICCGRPLYDYGFLDVAERYLRNVLDQLRPYARAGVPIVGMEPSCLAVFKDEIKRMLPHDDDAKRLTQNACHFGEFFDKFGIEPPKLHGKALLWGHCHHRATGGIEPEQRVLEKMGLDVEPLSGGCCGLAGSWGFESGKWQISVDCGEQKLLPAVREAPADTVVVANGFSCKTQIQDASRSRRRALHLAQVMTMARETWSVDAAPGLPEDGYHGKKPSPSWGRRVARTVAPLAAGAGGVALLAGRLGRPDRTSRL
ncbi:MAG TPA: FAD-linked oxidase C-terminal domain-containing protein [Acidothermaceae bacterium]